MHVKSIALFNSWSNFLFKIQLFRCNVKETSITSIIFIFLFYRENLKKYRIEMRTYSPGLNPPPPCTHLYAFIMTPLSPTCVRTLRMASKEFTIFFVTY